MPFNRHWTIHYERAGIAEQDGAQFVGRVLKLVGDYARRHEGQFAALWVREGGKDKGGHVHILMHLPPSLSLHGRTRRWIGLAGGKCIAGVSHARSVGGTLSACADLSDAYRHNAEKVLAYVLKGASCQTGQEFGLPRSGERGPIIGKRCGRTQNLG